MHRPTGGPAPADPPADPPTHPPGAHTTDPPGPPQVDPRVLTALLDRHGWHRTGGNSGLYTRWTPPGRATTPSLLIPTGLDLPDSHDLLAEALTALARTTAPSARAVLTALATPSDEIHWHRATSATAGPAAWAAQDRLRTAARRILLAAAHAAHGRPGPHPAALPDRDNPAGLPDRDLIEAFPGQALPSPSLLDHVLLAIPPGDAPPSRRTSPSTPAAPSPNASTTPSTPPARPSTTSAPPAAPTRSTPPSPRASAANSPKPSPPVSTAPKAPPSPSPGPPPPARPPAAPPAPSPSSSPPATSPHSARPAPATGAPGPPCPPASPAPSYACAARAPAGPAPSGSASSPAPAPPTCAPPSTRTATAPPSTAYLAGVPLRVHGRLEVRGGRHHLTGTHDVAAVLVDDAERGRLTETLLGEED
ncbi:hypothetical protein [Streptomyces fradiae]|uniref:hypothetical protein n=1 Tax=Streptomyces fradiae TaxID=1906 RepID=UPI0035BE9897